MIRKSEYRLLHWLANQGARGSPVSKGQGLLVRKLLDRGFIERADGPGYRATKAGIDAQAAAFERYGAPR